MSATVGPAPETGGTTIFTEMTALAARTGAINLGQGFPDRDGPRRLLDAAREAVFAGHNQYPPLTGVPELRAAIAEQRAGRYRTRYSAAEEVLVTVGATEAITASVLALAGAGDEVIVFEPFYDSYGAAITMAGAVRRSVPLRPGPDGFHFDEAELRAAAGPRARLLILNSPHNPTGKVFTRDELETIAAICLEHDLTVITDEVYEYLCFDRRTHHTIAAIDGMAERTVVVSSAGKTFNVTGWKVGWLCGPAALVARIRNVKQYLSFAGGTPFQHAVASALRECGDWIGESCADLQRSRDVMVDGLTAAGVRVYPSEGTYFIQVDARSFGYGDGIELCRALPGLAGVAGVPSAVFFDSAEIGRPLVRLAFCKRADVIAEAVSRLARLAHATEEATTERTFA
jgi:N-succinyldiaminopimelate aminotransferase